MQTQKQREWYLKNRDRILKKRKEYYEANKEKEKLKQKKYYEKNKEKILIYKKQWANKNQEKICKKAKTYREDHKEKISNYKKEWRKNNKEYLKEYCKDYMKKRRKEDMLFKMKNNLRHNIAYSLKRKNYTKKCKTYKLLGVDYETAYNYLKYTWFINYNKELKENDLYEIDHIIPLSSANNEEEIIKLCNINNLQLLTPSDNSKKNNSLNYQSNYMKKIKEV